MMLSVVILTKNEEDNIKDCLERVKFADETIVIDDNSDDKTTQIAKKLGAKVYKRDLADDFAKQRNFGLKKAEGKWVLFVDADERVPPQLAREIIQLVNDPLGQYSGFYLKRTDYIWGKKLTHGEVGSLSLLRLARRLGGKWRRPVHEVWEVIGRKRSLKNPILHFPHPNLTEFITSVNWHSSLHARANLEEGKKPTFVKRLYASGELKKEAI